MQLYLYSSSKAVGTNFNYRPTHIHITLYVRRTVHDEGEWDEVVYHKKSLPNYIRENVIIHIHIY